MFTTLYWRDVLERAIATFFEALIVLVGTNQSEWLNLDWGQILIMSAITAALAVAKSIASSSVGSKNPSIVPYEYPTDTR